jgi:hypothetical protein
VTASDERGEPPRSQIASTLVQMVDPWHEEVLHQVKSKPWQVADEVQQNDEGQGQSGATGHLYHPDQAGGGF